MTSLIIIGCIILYFVVGFFPLLWVMRKVAIDDHEIRNLLDVDDGTHAFVLLLVWSIWILAVPILLCILYSTWRSRQEKVSLFTKIIRNLFSNNPQKEKKEDYI